MTGRNLFIQYSTCAGELLLVEDIKNGEDKQQRTRETTEEKGTIR